MMLEWDVTYNLAHEDDILSSNEEDASCNVAVAVADKDSLHRVLQHEVGCSDAKVYGNVGSVRGC